MKTAQERNQRVVGKKRRVTTLDIGLFSYADFRYVVHVSLDNFFLNLLRKAIFTHDYI